MIRTMQEVEINWPVKALFNYVADITNHASWKRGTTDAIWVDGKNEFGATFKELVGDQATEYQITEFVPYQRRAIRSAKGVVSKTYVFEFEPKGPSTILRLSVNVQSKIPMPLFPVLAEPFVRSNDLLRLKEILEDEN